MVTYETYRNLIVHKQLKVYGVLLEGTLLKRENPSRHVKNEISNHAHSKKE